MKTLVVIPTYNEKENLPLIIKAIFDLPFKDIQILVIDDSSPDGTGTLAEGLKKTYRNLYVLHRNKKEGLGRAYIDGFKYALAHLQFDYLIQMDADFSHNPQDIIRIVDKLKTYKVVIGSRHIKGAKLEYPSYRKLLSILANFYARTVLWLPVHDCTAGFKGYQRQVIERIIKERYYSNNYAFQCEILFYTKKHGFSLKEIPIVFQDRIRGVSKMTFANIIDGFQGILKVRLRNYLG